MNMALRGGGEEMIVQFMLRLPADLRASIKDRAKAMGLSANAFPSPYGDFGFLHGQVSVVPTRSDTLFPSPYGDFKF